MAKAKTLFDCVGDWFEAVIQEEFPDLKKVKNGKGVRPDFSGEVFDAEAKAGFWDYGAQLKEAQVSGFTPNGKPIIYVVGYHTAVGLLQSTRKMSAREIDLMLQREAGMHSSYLVSNDIIKKLWGRESHVAASNPEWEYFSLRPRHLDAIIRNLPFQRRGVRHMPSRWYGISRKDLLLQPAPPLEGRRQNLQFGAILDRETDKEVIEYMDRKGLIHVESKSL